MTSRTSKRGRFDFPVIDSDGHTIEFVPALFDVLDNVAGPKVVERYGGEIAAAPADPQGTVFWFTLPAVKAS